MSNALRFDVIGVGLLGPGLPSWSEGRARLRDPSSWSCIPTVVPPPARLAPTERRRAGAFVKASIVVADEACSMAGVDPAGLVTVFTSATGDPALCHAMCEALAQPVRTMSPTRFTNSVHNAPAGYWHIATGSRQASTSLCAFDGSFAAGLLEAATQCVAGNAPVLLVACDVPYPEPLNALRNVSDVFALALLLSPAAGGSGAHIELTLGAAASSGGCTDAGLQRVRDTIPAAQALPLLQALALEQPTDLSLLAHDDFSLQLRVRPSP